MTKKATFGAGCFWGVEAAFRQMEGVTATAVGYAGGMVSNPTYEQVCSDRTGHAEVVQVEYDPARVSYEDLLKVFWEEHDPTQLNRQGPDVGTQYRSAIWYTSPEQQRAAEGYIDQLGKAKAFDRPIVTEVAPLEAFDLAEAYHQDYAAKHPYSPYIRMHDAPKVRELERQHPELYSDARVAYVAAR